MYLVVFIIIATVLIFSLWMLFKFFTHENSSKKIINPLTNNEKNDDSDHKIKLSVQEKIELSWRFLKEITSKVLKFSTLDKERIKMCGIILKNHGMKYQHVVEINNIKKYSSRNLSTKDKNIKALDR